MRSSRRGIIATVTAAALAMVIVACSKSEEDDAMTPGSRAERLSTPNPPYLLGDDSVERLISALKDLRLEYAREYPPSDPKNAGKMVMISVGITRLIARSGEILKLHGFASKDEFEQALAHVQRAFAVAALSGTRGLDGQSLHQKLDESQQVLIKELETTKHDQNLSADARSTKIAEIEAAIAAYQRHLDEGDDISKAIKSESSAIPEQNIAAVTKYLDELKAVLTPIQNR